MIAKAVVLSGLLAAAAMAITPAQFYPRHLRGGTAYAGALKADVDHRRLRGFNEPNYTVNWFTQQVDHSDPSQGTFQQRWYVDNSHYAGNNLAILYIAGEGPVESTMTGFVQDYAYQKGALLFTLEHRWYGDSVPQPVTIANMMKTLRLNQAMQDFVSFADAIDSSYGDRTPKTWVLAGGSYSGALVAWLKQQHPNRFAASWSSSGVVEAIFDFYQYDAHIDKVISPQCADQIKSVFALANAEWDGGDRVRLERLFGGRTRRGMQFGIKNLYSTAIEYSQKTEFCNKILLPSTDPLLQFAKAGLRLFGANAAQTHHTRAVAHFRKSAAAAHQAAEKTLNKNAAHHVALDASYVTEYSWMWQACSTFAWWQIGYPGGLAPTDLSTSMLLDECREVFTPTVFPDTYAFNKAYGGFMPNATHVIALIASDDPFGPSQVRVSRPGYPRVVAQCTDCGHGGDMAPPSPYDPDSKKAQRRAIVQHLDEWIADAVNAKMNKLL